MARYDDDYGYEPDGRRFGDRHDGGSYDEYEDEEYDTRLILPPRNTFLRILLWPLYAPINGLNWLRLIWWDEVMNAATDWKRWRATMVIALPLGTIIAWIGLFRVIPGYGWLYVISAILCPLILAHALIVTVMTWLMHED